MEDLPLCHPAFPLCRSIMVLFIPSDRNPAGVCVHRRALAAHSAARPGRGKKCQNPGYKGTGYATHCPSFPSPVHTGRQLPGAPSSHPWDRTDLACRSVCEGSVKVLRPRVHYPSLAVEGSVHVGDSARRVCLQIGKKAASISGLSPIGRKIQTREI